MTTTEDKVLKILKDFKEKVHSSQIARKLGISPGYVDLILRAFQRKGRIEFSGGWASLPKKEAKKKIEKKARKKKAKKLKKEDKKPKRKAIKTKEAKASLIKVEGITKELEKSLRKAGYENIKDLAEAPISRLMEDTGLQLKQAAHLINEARKILKIIPNYGK